jgi:hypothetical protein
VLAYIREMKPPFECPARTYGPGTPAACSSAWRSVTAAMKVDGWGTGSLRLTNPSVPTTALVPGRS